MSKKKKVKTKKISKAKETAREKMIGQHIGYRYDVNLVFIIQRNTSNNSDFKSDENYFAELIELVIEVKFSGCPESVSVMSHKNLVHVKL